MRLTYDQQTSVAPADTPADAQGTNFTPAVGNAIENVGNEGSKLVSDYNRIQFQQKEADGVAALQKNISDGFRQFTQFSEDQKTQVPENGAGYTDRITKSLDDWTSQLVDQQTTPKLKRMAAEQARTLGDHFFNQATQWQVGTNRAYRVNSIDESINTDGATIQNNPDLYQPLLNDKLNAISAVSSELHPEDKVTLSNKVRQTYAEAASLGFTQKAPQTVANLLTGQQPLPQGGLPQKIVAGAKASGVDPQSALAIAQFESGMDPNAVNAKSGATGLYQFLGSTWGDYGQGDAKDPDANIQAGMKFMADNSKAFQSTMGRAPTTPELYSMHLLGLGGGMALTKAPGNEPMIDLVSKYDPNNAAAVVNNNGFNGLTVAQVKQKIGGWMQDATMKTAGMANAPEGDEEPQTKMPAFFEQLSPQGRQAMLTHAQTLLRKDDSQARALVSGQIKDTIAAYQRGENAPNPPTFDSMVKAGLPANEAAQQVQTLNQWQTFGSQYAQVKTMPPDQQAELFKNATPQPGPGYATAAETHDALGRAIQYVNQQRQADPISYDQNDGTQTTKPLDFSDAQFLTGPLAARFVQAQQVSQNSGTAYQPFSKQEATDLGNFLQDADAKTSIGYLGSVAAAADTPAHYTAAMSQIAAGHPILATAGMLAKTNPQAAQMVLQGDRLLNPPKGEKSSIVMPSHEKFSAQFEQDMGAAYAGLPQTAQADKQAIIAYYVASQPAGSRSDKEIDPDLWEKAIDAVAPSTDYNGRKTLIPPGMQASQFGDTIASRWGTALQASGANPDDYPARAYQLASAGQDGAYIPYQGTTPLYVNGRPVVIDLNAPQAQPQTPTEPTRQPMKGRKLTVANLGADKRFK